MEVKELNKLLISYIALTVMFIGISIIMRLYLNSFLDVWHMSNLGKYLLLNAFLSFSGVLSAMLSYIKDKVGLFVTFAITAVLVVVDLQKIWLDINATGGLGTLVFPIFFIHLYLLIIAGKRRIQLLS